MTATDGTLPYNWSFSSGGLTGCTGLSLVTVASMGSIRGIPTVAATCAFTEEVTDSATPTPLISTQLNSITINAVVITPTVIGGTVKITGSVVVQ